MPTETLPSLTTLDLKNTIKLIKRVKDISGEEVEVIATLLYKFTTIEEAMTALQEQPQPETEPATPSEEDANEPAPANDPENPAETTENADSPSEEGV